MGIRRKIVHINEEKCDGCGLCVPACSEGAIQIIDGKARLVSEVYCDGLGACLGECPQDAITIEEREAEAFDSRAVEEHLATIGQGSSKPEPAEPPKPAGAFQGCPGALSRMLRERGPRPQPRATAPQTSSSQPGAAGPQTLPPIPQPAESALANWPVQLNLVPVQAPYFQGSTLLIAADCVPFAFADFHRRFLDGKTLLVGCPKLDDALHYREKLAAIFGGSEIDAFEVVFMEVPCCFGLVQIVTLALADSGKQIPLRLVKIGLRGEVLEETECSLATT